MSTNIHPTVILEPGVQIGEDTVVGPYTVIEKDVVVGDRCIIGSHVMLGEGCRIGDESRIFKGAAIGLEPQDKKFDNEKTYTFIGKRTVLREFVTVNRGTVDRGETRIGNDCWIMAYCHVAHDCLLGNNVTISNGLAMAGHVEVGNYVTIGGIVPIHQFTRIGDYAIVGAVTRPFMDVVPFSMVGGEATTHIIGINKVGLERHGFSEERRADIKRAYRILFRDGLKLTDAITLLSEKFPANDDIKLLIDFLQKPSKRGIMRMSND